MLRIDSEMNAKFKLAKALLSRKGRGKHEKFLVEGLRNIELAIQYDFPVENIFLREDMTDDFEIGNLLEAQRDKVAVLSEKMFSQISDTVHSQGVAGICPIIKLPFDSREKDIILIMDRIQDPGNAGTLIRTADAAGIRDIFFTKGTTDFYAPKVVRAAMGSIFYMNFHEMKDISFLKSENYHIVASCLETNTWYDELQHKKKIALIVGNEANGIAPELLAQADEKVKIPIYGKAESLNVAIAGAILMYKIKENNTHEKNKGE